MHRVVGFDLDGTLFDDRQYVRAGLERAGAELASITGQDLTDHLLEAYFDRGITEGTFDTVLAEHDLSQRHVSRLVDAYHDTDGELTPYPGVRPTLRTLGRCYTLAVITGGRNGTDKLDRLGLAEYLDTVIVTTNRSDSKRDPGPFVALLDRHDVSPSAVAYVGDRPELDFPQPNALGMDTVRVLTGRYADAPASGTASPDATVSALTELPATLLELD